MVALRRCLYTFFLSKNQPHLAEHSNYEEIFGKQLELLVSTDIAADVYDVLDIDGGVVPMCDTWVEIALRQAADMTDDEYDRCDRAATRFLLHQNALAMIYWMRKEKLYKVTFKSHLFWHLAKQCRWTGTSLSLDLSLG